MEYIDSFKEFDFNRDFQAVVIDNEDFDETHEVKLFVFELMMTTLQDKPRTIEKSLNANNIINKNQLNIEENISVGNYLICQPLINNTTNEPLRRPEIMDRVILKFFNGNPKFPYYIDMHFSEKKDPYENLNIDPYKKMIKGNYFRLLMYRDENMKGKDVDTVGKALEGLGYKANKYNEENYIFDRDMLNSLLSFQKDNKLKTDGDVGPITFTKLKEKYNNRIFY